MTSFSRNIASALGAMALLVLSACAVDPQTAPEVDLPAPTEHGWEALAGLIVNADAAAVKAILGKGADPNARDPRNGSTPLMLAAFLGRVDIAKMLLAAGADLKAMNNDGATALSVAEFDRATTAYFASMFGIPLSDPDAVERGKAEIARMLRAKL